jgi:hypothetical protein
LSGPQAAAAVAVNGGVPSFNRQRGFQNAIADNGVGDLTLTLTEPLDTDLEGCVVTGLQNNAIGNIAVESVDATHLRIRTFSGGVATDLHFWIMVWRLPPV